MHDREEVADLVRSALRLLRTHLGLDVAFVSELLPDERVFRFVDADGESCPVEVGASDPLEEAYCSYVVKGELPQFLADPSQHPVARRLEVTSELPVGTHYSVPIEFSDGSVYGTFCCFGFQVHDSLGQRDLEAVRMMADMVADHLEQAERSARELDRRREQLRVLAGGEGLEIVVQPIVVLRSGEPVGHEALSRFPGMDGGPEQIFAEAWRLGCGTELELAAAGAALDVLPNLPDGNYLTLNASPLTVCSDPFFELVNAVPAERIVVEITEHAAVEDYELLDTALLSLRELGIRLAIDDVGTGFSGLDQILRLQPNILKMDGVLVSGIDHSTAKQAMVAGLVTFATRMGISVVAERIETQDELRTLGVLGVEYGQGYLFGRPASAQLHDAGQLADRGT